MPSITQTIPLYVGDAPNRNTQTPTEFSDNADNFSAYFADVPADYNTFASQANALRIEVNAANTSAVDSAALALQYKNQALAAANFKGLWEDLTGALSIPATVGHLGSLWFLVTNTTNVTLDEPSVSDKWEKFVGGWDNQTTSVIAYPNSPLSLKVTTASLVTISPTFIIGDEFSIHNSSRSTADITLVNADYDISGPVGEAVAGTDITIKAGQTLKMQAESLTEFEIV